MVAHILWAPGSFWFFLQENLPAHKIPLVLGGGGFGFFFWGGECQFYFYGRGDFSETFWGVARKGPYLTNPFDSIGLGPLALAANST